MKYVPNLIPEHSRVNIDFNKTLTAKNSKPPDFIRYVLLTFAGFFLLAGLANVFTRFYVGFPILIIGAILIPDVHRKIEETLKFKFNYKIKSGMIAICFAIAAITLPNYKAKEREIVAIQKAKEEKALAEEKIRKEEEERKLKMEKEFLTSYPFITAIEYNQWLSISADSANNSDYKRVAFINSKKKEHTRRQQDALRLAKEEERKEKQAARKREIEQQRIYEANTEYYNGHVVYTGPRGGKYYINSHGNKTYIHR